VSRSGPVSEAIVVFPDAASASAAAARRLAVLLRARAAAGRRVVLGLATGSTMVGVYGELVRLHRDEGLSFAHVSSFNLDEYWPMPADHPRSYRRFMHEQLVDHVDLDPARVHLPSGVVPAGALSEHCIEYERRIRAAGDIDHFLLGIGRTGHIGFNEPGSAVSSRTRLVTLDERTLADNLRLGPPGSELPSQAITMGVGTILEARCISLLAFGAHKAEIVARALLGPVCEEVAASALQYHGGVEVLLDEEAAGALPPELRREGRRRAAQPSAGPRGCSS